MILFVGASQPEEAALQTTKRRGRMDQSSRMRWVIEKGVSQQVGWTASARSLNTMDTTP